MIVCDKKRLTEKQLVDFLLKIDEDFPIPLSDKVNIVEYAKKLLDKANLIADIEGDSIRGLVAGYTQDIVGESAYISLVGVKSEFRAQGIGKQLVKKFMDVCVAKEIKSVNLYTHQTNVAAIKMYTTLGFDIYKMKEEVRTQDIHYIYYFKNSRG